MNERDLLKQHILTLNVKTQAWMDAAPEGGIRMGAIYDDMDIDNRMNDYGVKTSADWDAITAWEDYYDVYKAYNNVRPRWTKWSDKTAEEWAREIELLAIRKH